jgi:hypothetical protein
VHAFLDRPLVGEWPYLWLDATDEIDKPPLQTKPRFLFGQEAPFFCPGQVPDRAARSWAMRA